MCTYLAKRGSTYYFRRPVPAELRSIVGRREWMQSLRTRDRAAAKRLIPGYVVSSDAAIADAQARLAAGGRPEPARGGAIPLEELEAMEESAAIAGAEEAEAMMPEAVFSERYAGKIAEIEQGLNKPLFAQTPDTAAVVLAAKRVLQRDRERGWDEAGKQFVESGEVSARLAPDKAPAETAGHVVSLRPGKRAATIMGTYDAYAKDAGIRASTIRNGRPHIQRLVDYLGHNDLARVTPDDLLGWIAALRETPGQQGTLLSAKTIRDGYFSSARALFTWAVEQRIRTDNPALGLRVRGRRPPRLRDRGFTDTEAGKVLPAAWAYTNADIKPCYARAIKWLPWIMAYTGARGGEIAQLRAEDVQQVDGVWIIRITPEAGSVKTDELRQVPLHPHLIELGLPELARTIGSGPMFYEPTAHWRTASKPVERAARFVRGLGITDIAQPTHGWRHRFKTEGRRWHMDGEAIDVIQGHAPANVGGSYGAWPLDRLREEIEKLPRYATKPDAAG